MMGLELHLFQMIKGGVKSLYYDIDGKKKNIFFLMLWFIIIPLSIGIFCYYIKWNFPDGTIDTMLSILGIFTALIFGVLFIAPDKFSQRVEIYKDREDEATRNYLIRYENFANSFVEQMTLLIINAIILIISLFSVLLLKKLILHSLSVALACEFISLFFILLSNVYVLLKDDIRISHQQKIR